MQDLTAKNFMHAVLVAAIVAFVVNIFILQIYEVELTSMEPTLFSGDQLLVDKTRFIFHEPSHNDIIILENPDDGTIIVKRIVGIPNDIIENSAGEFIVVPDRHVYVLGDNSEVSLDSRTFGPVPYNNIIGKVIIKF